MKANLMKDEENLEDLHPKKTVLNVKSKKFKAKVGKKKRIIRRKPLKFTSIIPQLEPKEDLDTKSSDDDDYKRSAKEPIYFFYPEVSPGYDTDDCEDFKVSEDSDKEEPPTSTKTYMLTSHASFVSAILLGTGEEPKMDSDYKMGVRVKCNNLFDPVDDEPEMVSDDENGVQVKSTRFQRDGGEPKMVSEYGVDVQVKSAL